VDEAHLFSGKNRARVVKQAEAFFCKKVKELTAQEWGEEDFSDALDDGYVETHNGSVCITWPTEHSEREKLAKAG
jgi:hypothetical protein